VRQAPYFRWFRARLVFRREKSNFVVKFKKMGIQTSPMSNLQLELLKLYSTNLSEQQLLDIKRMLATYFAEQIDREMTTLWEEKGWDDSTVKKWKQERLRTPY
jgi:hypothetical protein